jgi:hypothetical protein
MNSVKYIGMDVHNGSACELQSGLASSRTSDASRWEKKPKPLGRPWSGLARMARPVRTDPLQYVGLEARGSPAMGEIFSLDFSLYRTT